MRALGVCTVWNVLGSTCPELSAMDVVEGKAPNAQEIGQGAGAGVCRVPVCRARCPAWTRWRALAPVSQEAMLVNLSLGLPLLGATELCESPDVMWASMR